MSASKSRRATGRSVRAAKRKKKRFEKKFRKSPEYYDMKRRSKFNDAIMGDNATMEVLKTEQKHRHIIKKEQEFLDKKSKSTNPKGPTSRPETLAQLLEIEIQNSNGKKKSSSRTGPKGEADGPALNDGRDPFAKGKKMSNRAMKRQLNAKNKDLNELAPSKNDDKYLPRKLRAIVAFSKEQLRKEQSDPEQTKGAQGGEEEEEEEAKNPKRSRERSKEKLGSKGPSGKQQQRSKKSSKKKERQPKSDFKASEMESFDDFDKKRREQVQFGEQVDRPPDLSKIRLKKKKSNKEILAEAVARKQAGDPLEEVNEKTGAGARSKPSKKRERDAREEDSDSLKIRQNELLREKVIQSYRENKKKRMQVQKIQEERIKKRASSDKNAKKKKKKTPVYMEGEIEN